jgi:HEAT repeat protein
MTQPSTPPSDSPIDLAIADLTSGRRRRQEAAHEQILQMLEPDSIWRVALLSRLDEMLTHKNAQVRGTAYLALVSAQPEAALDKLKEHLDEPEGDARLDLVEALRMLGEEARPIVERFLTDELFEIRFAAAGALLDFCDPRCFDVLREGLGFSDTRYLALSGLYRLGDRRALEPARVVFGKLFISGFERVAAAGILAKFGDPDGLKFLLDRLKTKRGLERGLALELIGELKVPETFEAVRAVLLDPRDQFRGAAARAIGCLGNPEALAPLLALLDSEEDLDLCMDAAEGLMNLGTKEAKAALEEARQKLSAEASQQELFDVIVEALEHLPDNDEEASP